MSAVTSIAELRAKGDGRLVVDLVKEPGRVYIGRGNNRYHLPQSMWANPFTIGRDGTREQVIAKYRAWVVTQPLLMARLPELRGKTLVCWCKPEACHGDVLAELVDSIGNDDVDGRVASQRWADEMDRRLDAVAEQAAMTDEAPK